MATFNNFLQGVATQVTNTALKRVAGNLPGINNSYPYINNSSRGGESSDQLPLAPRGNFQHYTFPLDVMAEPGLGNQGHYMMFYINQQENVKIRYGGKDGSGASVTGTSERGVPSHLRKLNSKGSYVTVKNENGVRDQINLDSIFTDPFATEARFKDRGPGSLYARNYAAAVDRQAIAVRRAATKRMSSAIVMYMPAQVSAKYAAQYTDTEIGSITNAAMNLYEEVSSGNMRAAVDEMGNMLPEIAENQFLHRISTCILESMDVTYGGEKYKSYAGIDGDGAPPIETSLSLNFREIELITRERVHQGF